VLVAELALGGEQVGVLGQVLAVHYQVLPVHVDQEVLRIHPEGVDLLDGEERHPDVLHQDLHGGLAVLVLQKDLHVLLVGAVHYLRHALDEAAPGLRVGPLEGVVVPLGTGPDDEVSPDLAAQVHPALERVYALTADPLVRVYEGAPAVGRVGVEPRGDHRQVHPVLLEDARISARFSSLTSPG
jgi:hypothetical protein